MKKHLLSLLRSKVFGVLLIVGVGAYMIHAYNSAPPSLVKGTLRLGYSESGVIREAFIQKMASELGKAGAEVKLVKLKGTEDVQEALISKQLDLGIVMGGFDEPNWAELRELMPLYIEPLQLVVKKELYQDVTKDFGTLRGKRINLDDQHTGTHALAWEVLRFADLIPHNLKVGEKLPFEPTFFNQHQVMTMKKNELPDALFISGAVPSITVQNLVMDHGYRLVDIPFGESFSLDRFREVPASQHLYGTQLAVDKNYIYEASIPAYAYGVQPAVPSHKMPTLGTRLLLLAAKDLDADVASGVIATVLDPSVADFVTPSLSAKILESDSEYDEHPGRFKYLGSQKHITADDIFNFYDEVLQKWGVLAALFLFIQAKLSSFFARREEKPLVSEYMKKVIAIEVQYSQYLAKTGSTVENWHELDDAISMIKHEVMHHYMNGNLEDPDSVPHFLSMVAAAHQRLSSSERTSKRALAQVS